MNYTEWIINGYFINENIEVHNINTYFVLMMEFV